MAFAAVEVSHRVAEAAVRMNTGCPVIAKWKVIIRACGQAETVGGYLRGMLHVMMAIQIPTIGRVYSQSLGTRPDVAISTVLGMILGPASYVLTKSESQVCICVSATAALAAPGGCGIKVPAPVCSSKKALSLASTVALSMIEKKGEFCQRTRSSLTGKGSSTRLYLRAL